MRLFGALNFLALLVIFALGLLVFVVLVLLVLRLLLRTHSLLQLVLFQLDLLLGVELRFEIEAILHRFELHRRFEADLEFMEESEDKALADSRCFFGNRFALKLSLDFLGQRELIVRLFVLLVSCLVANCHIHLNLGIYNLRWIQIWIATGHLI